VTVDRYDGAGPGWARGASLVYEPIAAELVSLAPRPLTSHVVLDAGAGTGVATAPLVRQGAIPIAVDYSHHMLAVDAANRPPSAVADILAMPLATAAVDDAVAAFVLNHLTDPTGALAELQRVVRPGGSILACVYGTASRSAVRDRIDEVAGGAGWEAPNWYRELKASSAPLLGTAAAMEAAAHQTGLANVCVDERAVDVGVTEPEQLVDYRLGQAHFAGWLEAIGPTADAEVRAAAAEAVRPIMEPYRPIVVFLSATVDRNGSASPSSHSASDRPQVF
jgi:SAM-dependent methyltransferase